MTKKGSTRLRKINESGQKNIFFNVKCEPSRSGIIVTTYYYITVYKPVRQYKINASKPVGVDILYDIWIRFNYFDSISIKLTVSSDSGRARPSQRVMRLLGRLLYS